MAVQICEIPKAGLLQVEAEQSPTSSSIAIVSGSEVGARQHELLMELSQEFRAIQRGKGDNTRFKTAITELPNYRMVDAAHEVRGLLDDDQNAVTPILVDTLTSLADNLRERGMHDFCEQLIGEAVQRSQFISSMASALLMKGGAYLIHANLYLQRGEVECAKNVYMHSLDILDKAGLNGAHTFLKHLSRAMQALEVAQPAERHRFFLSIERLANSVYRQDNPDSVSALRAVAKHYIDFGYDGKAERILFRLLNTDRDKPEFERAVTLECLAKLYEHQGKLELSRACQYQVKNCSAGAPAS